MKKNFVFLILLFTGFNLIGQETFRDNFSSVSYANNDGSQNFSNSWTEVNDGGSPSSGRITINSNQLRFVNLDNRSITRDFDLNGASAAVLTLDYNRTNGNESILVQLLDGGAYTTVATLNGTGSITYNLTASQRTASASIRFITGSGNWGNSETIFVDNVQISATYSPNIVVSDAVVDEDGGTVTITATHAGPDATGAFTVNYQTNDGSATAGSDYTAATGTLSFNGTAGDAVNIVLNITDDFTFEGTENFSVSLTSTSDPAVVITDTGTVTINDNESDPNDVRPYEERVAQNLIGNFKMFGNTNLQCVSGCPASPVTNNPSVVMGYIDVDSDAGTVNSSSSDLNLPAGATVSWAGLYWGGMYNSSNSGITNPGGSLNIDQVKFMTPTSGSYATIDAQVRNIETVAFSGWNTFMAYAEVTTLVQAGGNGSYFTADISLATGSSFTGPHGGWTLVVIYEDPADTSRNVSVWDGFDFFGFGANDSFTVTGLLTPSMGAFETHVGYYGMDGEASFTGDFVSVEGTNLTNALNPGTNILNGTISEFGVDTGARNPNFGYSWGVDIDVFDASGLVPNNATDMDVVLGSSSEGIWGGVFVTSNEIAFPTVATIYFDPDLVFQSDESTVTITIENPANGVSLTNLSLLNSLPADMIIAPTPDATSSCGGSLTATTGASSFQASGINLAPGGSCTFTFDVVTTSSGLFLNTISPMDISNDQNIPLSGIQSASLNVVPKPYSVISNRRITYRVNR